MRRSLQSVLAALALLGAAVAPASAVTTATIVPVPGDVEAVSPEGRLVLFSSGAAILAPSDPPGAFERDLFLHDRSSGATVKVGDHVADGDLSADGSVVAFTSFADLSPSDTNGVADVYLRVGTATSLVTSGAGGGPSNGTGSGGVQVSANGAVVAFSSFASNLVAGDDDGARDVFALDRATGTMTRMPAPPTGPLLAAEVLAVSPDGGRIAAATTTTDGSEDPAVTSVLWDRTTGTVTILPVVGAVVFEPDGGRLHVLSQARTSSTAVTITVTSIDAVTGAVAGSASFPAPEPLVLDTDPMTPTESAWDGRMAADGRRVALAQRPFGTTLWVHDLPTGESVLVAETPVPFSLAGRPFVLSEDGRVVVYPAADSLAAAEVSPSRFSDTGTSIFRDDILWLAWSGVTRGCTPDGRRFCPDDPVTRGQMAAFLTRALRLPAPPEGDPFTDDSGIFETDIEALAAAGITRGCTPDGRRFCPDDPVTRGQMAAFLHRALTDT